jgi:hypothetical protein
MATITRTHEPLLFNLCSMGKTSYSLVLDGGTHLGVATRPAFGVFGLRIVFESAGVVFNYGVARMTREKFLCLVPVCVPAITVTVRATPCWRTPCGLCGTAAACVCVHRDAAAAARSPAAAAAPRAVLL